MDGGLVSLPQHGGSGTRLGPRGSKSPTTFGVIATVEGGFLGPTGGAFHDGGLPGEGLGPRGSKSPTTFGVIATVEGGFLVPMGGTFHDGGLPGEGLGPIGSKSPTTFGVIATVEGGFLGPPGGIFHDGGIATIGGGWLGPEGGTLPRGSKSPTMPCGIAEYGCASTIAVKSVVRSVSATTATIDDAVAPTILFLLLAMASL
jgi:hypothetical protein